jgi:hypothetical protein
MDAPRHLGRIRIARLGLLRPSIFSDVIKRRRKGSEGTFWRSSTRLRIALFVAFAALIAAAQSHSRVAIDVVGIIAVLVAIAVVIVDLRNLVRLRGSRRGPEIGDKDSTQ